MFRNYVVTALRNILRHKGYAFINVAGLAIGFICSFFIVLWVQDELNYDQFLDESDQVYRVMRHATFGGTTGTTSSMPKPLGDVLDEEYPEITHTVLMSWDVNMVLTYENRAFRVEGRYFGSDFFSVFKFPVLAGDPTSALQDPESIVFTEALAERYFGSDWRAQEDLIGTIIRVDNDRDVRLTAVMEDVPANSSLQFEYVLPMESFIRENDWVESWGNNGLRMFARLDAGADHVAVSAKIRDLIDQHVDAWESDVFLQPLADMYLRSDYEDGQLVGGRIDYVRIFLLVAVFIILIASINFMNLATARSALRAREIGVRKSLGATQTSLAAQFLGESVLTALLAFAVAMAAVLLLLPSFNELTNKSVVVSLADPQLWLQFGGLALLTGLVAGSYPALYLSSFNVIAVLRGTSNKSTKGGSLRKGLVVFQFIMSIILIVGTLTVYQQLSYIRDKDLGVDRENVVYLALEGGVRDQFDTFQQELTNEPGVVGVARSSSNPLSIGQDTIGAQWEGKAEGDNTLFSIISTGFDFIETMGIERVDGRFFSEDFGADSSNYVINEMAAATMGMDDPVGQRLTLWGDEGLIVGVVKDFHMRSLYGPIEPVIFRLAPESTWMLFVRLGAGQTEQGLASLERVYNKFNPEYPLTYRFLDDEYEQTYRSEIVIGTLANIFAIFAVVIACLGLFGLASFTAEQRRKEIGIRKVMGASVPGIVMLLSREFIVLVVGAYAVAAPIAYYVMTDWLQEFAFHTEISIGILAGAGILAVVIAWLTVSYQSVRAASANPVVSLRAE